MDTVDIVKIKKGAYSESDAVRCELVHCILTSTIDITYSSGDIVTVELANGCFDPKLGCNVFLNGKKTEYIAWGYGLVSTAVRAAERYAICKTVSPQHAGYYEGKCESGIIADKSSKIKAEYAN